MSDVVPGWEPVLDRVGAREAVRVGECADCVIEWVGL